MENYVYWMDCLSAHQTKIHNEFDNWNNTVYTFSLLTSFIHFLLCRRFIGIDDSFALLFIRTTHSHVRIIGFELIFHYLSELAELGGSNFGCCCNSFFTDADIFDQLNDENDENQQLHDEYDFENDDDDNDETDIWFYNVPFGQFFTFAISFALTLSHNSNERQLCLCICMCVPTSTSSCVGFLLRRINSNANAVVVFKKPFPCVGLGTHVYLQCFWQLNKMCRAWATQLIDTHAHTCDS